MAKVDIVQLRPDEYDVTCSGNWYKLGKPPLWQSLFTLKPIPSQALAELQPVYTHNAIEEALEMIAIGTIECPQDDISALHVAQLVTHLLLPKPVQHLHPDAQAELELSKNDSSAFLERMGIGLRVVDSLVVQRSDITSEQRTLIRSAIFYTAMMLSIDGLRARPSEYRIIDGGLRKAQ